MDTDHDCPPLDSSDLPVNEVYNQGVDCGTWRSPVTVSGDTWDTVCFDQPVRTDDTVQQATERVAQAYYYGNMAHVLLCGRIIRHEMADIPLDAKKLAVVLSAEQTENVDIWRRYLSHLNVETEEAQVTGALKQYYQHLFSQDCAISSLLGVQTIGGPLSRTVCMALEKTGDHVFQQIMETMVDQKSRQIVRTVDCLRPAINQLPAEEQQQLRELADTYRSHTGPIIQGYAPALDAVGCCPERLERTVQENVRGFHRRLGVYKEE